MYGGDFFPFSGCGSVVAAYFIFVDSFTSFLVCKPSKIKTESRLLGLLCAFADPYIFARVGPTLTTFVFS